MRGERLGSIKRYYAIAVTLGFILCLWQACGSMSGEKIIRGLRRSHHDGGVCRIDGGHWRCAAACTGLAAVDRGLIAIGALLSVNYYVSLRTNAHEQRVAVGRNAVEV